MRLILRLMFAWVSTKRKKWQACEGDVVLIRIPPGQQNVQMQRFCDYFAVFKLVVSRGIATLNGKDI